MHQVSKPGTHDTLTRIAKPHPLVYAGLEGPYGIRSTLQTGGVLTLGGHGMVTLRTRPGTSDLRGEHRA
jgi:hypothetical protein